MLFVKFHPFTKYLQMRKEGILRKTVPKQGRMCYNIRWFTGSTQIPEAEILFIKKSYKMEDYTNGKQVLLPVHRR